MWIKSITAATLLGVVGASGAAQALDNFSAATTAFQGGEYRRALALFELEQRQGNDSAKLLYNIGVTHFKLGNYREAGRYFGLLLEHSQWRDLARFQLGLIAEKQGDRPGAIRQYTEVKAQADSPKLRSLSGKRLAAMASGEPRATAPSNKQWLTLASISAGYDDNAFAMQNELLSKSSIGEDSFTDLFAWGQYRLKGTAKDGWRLQGLAYRRGYSEYSILDIGSYSVGLSRDLRWNGWQTELGATLGTTYLDGEQLTRETQIAAELKKTISAVEIGLAYLPSHYSGGSDYPHLDGWRHRVEASLERPWGPVTVAALYRLDINDRADRQGATGDLYSYSPTRHSTILELEWPVQNNWRLSVGVEYRASEYDGVNSLTDTDGVLKEEVREADRTRSWLKSQFFLSPRLQLAGKVSFTDNEENFDIYTYDKTEASLGVRYTF